MWPKRSLNLWIVVAVGIFAVAQNRTQPFSDPTAPPFLVRIQHTVSDQQVCGLIREDGLFHVERETRNRVEVLEGILNESELADLRSVLNEKGLIALSQQKIVGSLVVHGRDVLQISILKQGNRMLRSLLVEAAQIAVRFDPEMKKEYLHRCHQKPKGVAKVATARKLAVRLYWMLRTNVAYPEIVRIESSPRVPLVGAS